MPARELRGSGLRRGKMKRLKRSKPEPPPLDASLPSGRGLYLCFSRRKHTRRRCILSYTPSMCILLHLEVQQPRCILRAVEHFLGPYLLLTLARSMERMQPIADVLYSCMYLSRRLPRALFAQTRGILLSRLYYIGLARGRTEPTFSVARPAELNMKFLCVSVIVWFLWDIIFLNSSSFLTAFQFEFCDSFAENSLFIIFLRKKLSTQLIIKKIVET